jgi:hypothetical protein
LSQAVHSHGSGWGRGIRYRTLHRCTVRDQVLAEKGKKLGTLEPGTVCALSAASPGY